MAMPTPERADRIRTQKKNDKNKRYALHAPEVQCISKGKARNRYEFGVKVSLARSSRINLPRIVRWRWVVRVRRLN